MRVRGASKQCHPCRVAREQVKTRNQAIHPMHEKGEMNDGIPWQNVPRHGTLAQLPLHSWHDASQHGEEDALRDGGRAVESERTASLADDLARARLARVAASRIAARVRARSPLTPAPRPSLPCSISTTPSPPDRAFPNARACLDSAGSPCRSRCAAPHRKEHPAARDRGRRFVAAVAGPVASSAGQMTAMQSGCSRSAPSKSSARSIPNKAASVSSANPSSSSMRQPSVRAAIRTLPIACPTSCWQ